MRTTTICLFLITFLVLCSTWTVRAESVEETRVLCGNDDASTTLMMTYVPLVILFLLSWAW